MSVVEIERGEEAQHDSRHHQLAAHVKGAARHMLTGRRRAAADTQGFKVSGAI